ncbi:MAG: hypothetical protein F6K26_50925 [Moorea sp. SIO2I5]|nr:hypothetical protein [Moorena sp. SIO2I5]
MHNYQVHRIFSFFPLPCSLLPAPCSLKTQNLYLIEVQTAKSDRNSRSPWQS